MYIRHFTNLNEVFVLNNVWACMHENNDYKVGTTASGPYRFIHV